MKTPIRYPGGKSKDLKTILDQFPANIDTYKEPFVGGGSVFMAVKSLKLAKTFYINDKFELLIKFYKACTSKENVELAQESLKKLRLLSVEELKAYHKLVKNSIHSAEGFELIAMFFFLSRVSFGGTLLAGGFSQSHATGRFTEKSIDNLKVLPDILNNVIITSEDYTHLFNKTSQSDFIFCDPPYFQTKGIYGPDGTLSQFNHKQLAEDLKTTSTKFLITYDDCEEIRDLYKWATIIPWTKTYSLAKKQGQELFIRNYEIN